MFSYINLEQRVAPGHPLRAIRQMVDQALGDLSAHFDTLYARGGRPSIPPEQLLRALLLQVLYGLRSERQLMEQVDYNLLYRWFVGLAMDEAAWDATVYSKNRDRLLQGEVSQRLLAAVVEQARAQSLLSEEHFTVDGTLLEAWANRNSFEPKDPPPTKGTGSRGKKCLRDTHESRTDPEARLYKKSTAGEAKPSYLGHVIVENRNGLVVAACATPVEYDGGAGGGVGHAGRDGSNHHRSRARSPSRWGRTSCIRRRSLSRDCGNAGLRRMWRNTKKLRPTGRTF